MITIHQPDSSLLKTLTSADPRIHYHSVDEEKAIKWTKELGERLPYLFKPEMNQERTDRIVHCQGIITNIYSYFIDEKVEPILRSEFPRQKVGYRGITTATCPDFSVTGEPQLESREYLVKNILRTLRDGVEATSRDPRRDNNEFTRAYWDSNFMIPDCWVIDSFSFYPEYFRQHANEENRNHIFPALLVYSPEHFGRQDGFRTFLPESQKKREELILQVHLFDYIELDLDKLVETFGGVE